MSANTTRRQFLKSTAATGLALTASPYFFVPRARGQEAETQEPPPPQFPDLRIAFIGTGGMGGAHLAETINHGIQCPCYCDVDTTRYGEYPKHFPNARPYQDYREMFDKEHKNFDAVMIATPDHHHYPATAIAMQLEKHVYTQKPLTHTVWEARELAKAAKKYKVATQMGNQGHAGEGWRLVYEWVHSGVIGDVIETHTWTNRPWWPQGDVAPEESQTAPANLNWDVWLGPAGERPFANDVYHPFKWRGWWEYGCGALGDMACHTMDGIFWALEPGHPTAVETVASTLPTPVQYPASSIVRWEFPERGERPALKCYWYENGLRPTAPKELEANRELAETGNLYYGTKGILYIQGDYGQSPRLIPESRMREVGRPDELLERSPGHYLEWLMAAAGEKPFDFPKSNFAYAAPMTEVILLGTVAQRVGRRLDWDPEKLQFTNFPQANAYVSKTYRDGWEFKL